MLTSILLYLFCAAPGEELLMARASPEGVDRLTGSIGDRDGDGTPDLFSLQVGAQPEVVDLISGRTGKLLTSFPLTGFLPGAAQVAVPVGDVDGDGAVDVACGFPGEAGFDGAVRVYSTADGGLLHELFGAADQLGTALAGGHDFDGDGRDDFLVSATGPSARVTLHSGATGAALRTWTPPPGELEFGAALALLDDLDGDLVPDLGVGSPFLAGGGGRVWIESGASGSALGTVDRGFPWNGFGSALALLGDVDGDGLGEYAVGGLEGVQLRTQVLSGTSGAVVYDLAGTGSEVAGLGDVNGDGVPDLATTAPLNSVLDVWSGADGSALGSLRGAHPACAGDLDRDGLNDVSFAASPALYSSVVRTVTVAFGFAPAPHERYGFGGVEGLGDLDRDGFEDYAFGRDVISGRDASILRSYSGGPTAVDDLDGDGFRDLIVPEWSQGILYLRVRSFSTGQVLQQFSKPGVFSTGVRVFPVDDLDGDGLGDLVFGTPNASLAKPWAGGVFVHSLGTGAKLWAKQGRYPDGEFGVSVVSLDDQDGDGVPEIAVNAPLESPGSQIYVFSGASGALLRRIKVAPLGLLLSRPLLVVGDRDGDGFRDLAVTAWGGTGPSSVVYLSPLDGAPLGSILGDFTTSGGQLVGYFGASLALVGDYDGDGLPDLGVSAWGFDEGALFVFAADDGALLRRYQGRIDGERFGTSFASVDVTGDGLKDVVVSAPYSFGPAGPAARIELLDAAQASTASYCGLNASSHGCLPQILSQGLASRSQAAGFVLQTFQLEGQEDAILFIGHGQQQVPWQGGPANLCVRGALTRTDAHVTGGTSGTCDGSLSIDFNAWMAAHPNRAPGAGTAVFAQVWFTDRGNSSGAGLSSAVVFPVLP